ncbi:ATPase AAA [Phytohabitans flavus]|uniref:DNA helicase n=1 Tax=Phytohabitans flavus TaxID=1076124 RepID=A0A6F8XXZ6_9ACTN|nr:AAA family ATPase [Phytohabitans flavus]BCB78669.1 DNA helicase [Phytohabitans flavus]
MTLEEERAHLAASRAALARMLDLARHRVATGEQVAGDRYTAEMLGRMLKSYAKELAEEPDGPLYFGRLRFGTGPAAGDHSGQCYYIGRRHITDEAGEPMVIDWRAPVSRTFYRASARDPMGVAVRRRYGWQGGTLTGFEDEDLGAGQLVASRPVASRLLASRLVAEEIERPRVGPMRDIVATIQPDQDDLVRADLDESVCVQGAPGTGKTAVGLHRAAYLLYSHRRRLKRDGVLVIGPNPAFLRYISAVLPALGEVDIAQRTLDQVLARRRVTGTDSDAAAAVKHDARMASVLSRALYARLGEPSGPLTVAENSARWRIPEAALGRLIGQVWQESLPYGIGRERLRSRVVGLLQRQAEARGYAPGAAWIQRMGRSRPVRDFLDQVWPAVRPADVVAELLRDPSAAADGILTPAEQEAIVRRRARWSAADLVLVDEVAGLIDHPESYGHIIVDEAQDLSPMECRALARRSVHGSLTVLGDLAQGTTPWAATSWYEQLTHLGKPKARVVALTAGFRVPAAVLALANRLLATLDVDVPPTRAVRGEGSLHVRRADDLAAATAEAVREALGHEGSIGVITREPFALTADRVTVLHPAMAKGLEFDHVVLVEPADLPPRLLYVALTRAVSRLDIVHHRPLPPAIA